MQSLLALSSYLVKTSTKELHTCLQFAKRFEAALRTGVCVDISETSVSSYGPIHLHHGSTDNPAL